MRNIVYTKKVMEINTWFKIYIDMLLVDKLHILLSFSGESKSHDLLFICFLILFLHPRVRQIYVSSVK